MDEQIPIREYEQAVYVYWYGSALPAVKIGHSNDPDRRLAQLGNDTGVPDHLASFAAIVWLDRKREKVEARAHEMAAAFRRSGEWFEITASQALGYILDAAKEFNVRYEVEDRAGVYAEKRNSVESAVSQEVKNLTLDELRARVSAAKDAVTDADIQLLLAEDATEQQRATSSLTVAEATLNALVKIESAKTAAYNNWLIENRKRATAKEAYLNSHPNEWAIKQSADAKFEAKAIAAWNAKWTKS